MVLNPERILFLLKAYTDRKATPEEERELMDWLANYDDDGSFQTHIQQLFDAYPPEKKVEGVDWEKIYSVILGKRDAVIAPDQENAPRSISTHRVHFLRTSWFRYAAAIILLAGGATTWWLVRTPTMEVATTNGNKHLQADVAPGGNKAILTLADGSKIVLDNAQNGSLAQQGGTKVIKLDAGQLAYNIDQNTPRRVPTDELLYNTITTPRGGQYQIVLPDGSKVWLNAASSIKFPTSFSGNRREVEIRGEVYLEIAKNTKQPFMVKANGTEVRVLGTSFNINAYADEESIKTTLIEGSVKVSGEWSVVSGQKQEVILKPGQQAELTRNLQLTTHSADINQTLSWKNGLFNFNNLSLQQVLRQLSRWYDVDIVYEANVQPKKFGGEIQRDLNLSEVLDVLKDAGVHFTVEGKKLIVKP